MKMMNIDYWTTINTTPPAPPKINNHKTDGFIQAEYFHNAKKKKKKNNNKFTLKPLQFHSIYIPHSKVLGFD